MRHGIAGGGSFFLDINILRGAFFLLLRRWEGFVFVGKGKALFNGWMLFGILKIDHAL